MDNQQLPLITTYGKGLYSDGHSSVQPEGTYPFALNVVNKDKHQTTFRTNEHSNKKVITFDSPIKGFVHQDEFNRTIYLLQDQSLWYQDHNTETKHFIVRASEFGCEWEIDDCEWVDIQVYTKNCDSYIQWSSNFIYYIVNINQMLNPPRKAALIREIVSPTCKDCNKNCNYFKVFKPKCTPTINVKPYQTGGSLSSGAIFYSIRQLNSDKSVTNWTPLSIKPAYIYSEHNMTGEPANGRVEVTFKNLDCNYDKIEIAIVYQTSVSTTVRIYGPIYSSTTHYTFTHLSTNEGVPTTLEEILSVGQVNYEGKYQKPYNNRMYYYGIRPQKDYNVQKIANNIKVKFFVEKYSLELAKEHQITTLCRGESYSFGFWINHTDGTKTYGGNIPCGSSDGNAGFAGFKSLNQNLFSDGLPTGNTAGSGNPLVNVFADDNGGGSGAPTPASILIDVSTLGSVTVAAQYKLLRDRSAGKRVDSVESPDNSDQLLAIEKALVDSYTTEVKDLIDAIAPAEDPYPLVATGVGDCPPADFCDIPKDENNHFMESKDKQKNANIAAKNLQTAEEIGVKWASLLSDLIGSDKKDLIKLFNPTNIKDLTTDILNAVKNRESIIIEPAKYTVVKDQSYDGGGSGGGIPNLAFNFDGFNFGNNDNEEEVEDSTNSNEDNTSNSNQNEAPISTIYPGGTFIGSFDPICSKERDTKYPCVSDCEGVPIFGSKAGTSVYNHQVPDESVIPTYISHSTGVRSKMTPDADEYSDWYGYYIGAEFSDIIIDKDDYYRVTGKRICSINPYTIGQVKITDSNKTILTKGAVLGGFDSTNQGKKYTYQNLGVNSFEKCDKHIDTGDKTRMDPGATASNSGFLYSLDQSALMPYVGTATTLKVKSIISGVGYRHNQYAEGKLPSNKLLGRQIDLKGTVQSINLSKQELDNSEFTISGLKYIDPNSVSSPTRGSVIPVMNMYNQAALWIGGVTVPFKDKSFVGDGLDHDAPITNARTYYAVASRELYNQYGAVESRAYIPKIQAEGDVTTVRGLIGNRFISPYSFVKTNWVSDKVGNKFNIPDDEFSTNKSPRCVCDAPGDAIVSLLGVHYWTKLPKSGDKADAKNWCNLHTIGGVDGTNTRKWVSANGQSATESDMYYPATLTTLITYSGEWETNPWGVELSDILKEQRYQFIKPIYELGSQIDAKRDWENGYLDQFHAKLKQPSMAEKTMKILIESLIPVMIGMFKLESLLSTDGSFDLIANTASLPVYVGFLAIYSKIFATADFVNEFIGLPVCKQEKEGGIDVNVEDFFTNWNQFSSIFNREMDYLSNPQFTEMSSCCPLTSDNTINRIVISDPIFETSLANGYTQVKPNNYVDISQEKGDLKDLFDMNGRLYGHTTDGIYSLQLAQIQAGDSGFSFINGNDTLQPQLIIGSNPEGHAGIRSATHAHYSQIGRVFLDYDAQILYLYNGELNPISFKGVFNWFKNQTKYCNISACPDIHKDAYYAIGYDPRIQRVLITKGDKEASWTLSYDPITDNGQWISFHSYTPKNYLTTRENYYHLTDTEVYIHNVDVDSNGEFFGTKYPTIIDSKHTTIKSVQYNSHLIYSDVEIRNQQDGILFKRDFTFDKLGFYNSRQTSGLVDLTPIKIVNQNSKPEQLKDNYQTIDAIKSRDSWKVNELYDYTADSDKALIKYDNSCSYMYNLINFVANDAVTRQNLKQRRLSDLWYVTRLIWDNSKDNTKIYLKAIELKVQALNE